MVHLEEAEEVAALVDLGQASGVEQDLATVRVRDRVRGEAYRLRFGVRVRGEG